MKKYFLIIFAVLIQTINAQELNCNVTVNYEGLSINYREILSDFESVIESYMNKTQFTDNPWEGEKIVCNITIFFTGAGSEVEYSAQVVIVSTRPVYQSDRQSPMITINDASWSFRYEKGQALYSNQATFDPLTSFLDFYANIIIGFDWDTWAELGGTPYFQRATQIINLGANSGYKKGWERTSDVYNRVRFCDDLLNDKYRPFREALYEYHYGVDFFQVNKPVAQEHIANLVNVLDDIKTKTDLNSVLVRAFFDAKNGEIIDLLKDYRDKTIFEKLKKIDPAHIAKYDEALQL